MIITSSIFDIIPILKKGGVIAYPTEAVWGLGCDPFNRESVYRILALKNRPVHKGLILISGEAEHLTPWKDQLSPKQYQRLVSDTETPTSWVVPDTLIAPEWVRGDHASVAIRMIQHEQTRELCSHFGHVLVSTSANTAGHPPALTKDAVSQYFGDKVDAIFDAPLGHNNQPSQVKDLLCDTIYRN
jgi:L-threonylcarbamoyladenylate synthase